MQVTGIATQVSGPLLKSKDYQSTNIVVQQQLTWHLGILYKTKGQIAQCAPWMRKDGVHLKWNA